MSDVTKALEGLEAYLEGSCRVTGMVSPGQAEADFQTVKKWIDGVLATIPLDGKIISGLKAEIARVRGELDAKTTALEEARHALETLHGLTASDGVGAYGDALREGCDPSGAWDCFCDQTFTINTSKCVTTIEKALSGEGKGEDGVTAEEIGRRGSVTWVCPKCQSTVSVSRAFAGEKKCACCQTKKPNPLPDPPAESSGEGAGKCGKCGGEKRLFDYERSEWVDCSECNPFPDPPAESPIEHLARKVKEAEESLKNDPNRKYTPEEVVKARHPLPDPPADKPCDGLAKPCETCGGSGWTGAKDGTLVAIRCPHCKPKGDA
jgi:hypothetical protein